VKPVSVKMFIEILLQCEMANGTALNFAWFGNVCCCINFAGCDTSVPPVKA